MKREISERRRFYNIDRSRVRARILRMGAIVAPLLPKIVRDGLELACAGDGPSSPDLIPHSHLEPFFEDHFRLLLSDEFGSPLEESYHALSSALAASGHDTRLWVSVGSVVMRSILTAGAKRMIWRPFEFAKCGMAMGSLFSFDVSIALQLQIEQERAALRTRAGLIDSAIAEFRSDVVNVVDSINAATRSLIVSCETVDCATSDASKRSGEAVGDIAEATSRLRMSAHAVEEFGVAIGQIGEQASLGAKLAARVEQNTEASNKAMEILSSAINSIDSITQLIGAIAGQTNMLALNATIEAARAGEAGRGFAVVASEVKGLAAQVERATDQIKAILDQVRSASGVVMVEMNNVDKIIGGLSGTASSVSIAVQQQRQAVDEIGKNIDLVVSHNERLEKGIEALAGSSLASAREAVALKRMSDELKARAARLTAAFDELANNLRAA